MRIEHNCKNCGAIQVVTISVSTVNRQQTTFELLSGVKQDDTFPILLNFLGQNEMIIAAGVMAAATGICGAALVRLAGFPMEFTFGSMALSLPIGAMMPYFVKLVAIMERSKSEADEEVFTVKSLERVSNTQARMIKRDIRLPLDSRGIPLFSDNDLLGFARMVVENKDDISYAAGNRHGVKRVPFTKIRDWSITKGHLIWRDPGNHAQGVVVTGNGAYFRQLLAP